MNHRIVHLLPFVLAAVSCASRTHVDTPSDGGPDGPTRTFSFQGAPNRDVDLLVMLDNSLGMTPLQRKLASSFSALVDTLQGLPGGLPNLHLAVITSDMGAGPYNEDQIPSCRTGGDQGAFQNTMRLASYCDKGSLSADQTFIVASDAGGANNFTGDLANAFACMASSGDVGCGFEHQLASVLRALNADGNPAGLPPPNAGFLRPNAYLAILLVTDEDDCSAPPNSQLFDPDSRGLSDPLGPLSSYRCNEYGHLCGGQRPPRVPPAVEEDLGTCTSAEDETLLKVSDVAAKLRALKLDPAKVIVGALAGPPAPYVVEGVPASLDDPGGDWPAVVHSCAAADGTYADPAVRIKQLVDQFPETGLFQTICNDSFAPALTAFAQVVGKALSAAPCLDEGIEASSCTFTDYWYDDQGARVETPMPSCLDSGDEPPCWQPRSDVACAGQGLSFRHAAGPLPDGTTAVCPVK